MYSSRNHSAQIHTNQCLEIATISLRTPKINNTHHKKRKLNYYAKEKNVGPTYESQLFPL